MVEQRLIKAIQSAQPDVAFIVAYQNAPVAEHVFCEVYAIGDKFAGLPVFSNDSTTETVSTIYKYKVSLSYNGLVTSGAHDKAKQALKDLILRVYGAESKAIYIKDYGLKPDVALQAAVSDCKIKIETYFDTKAPKVGKQSDEVVWTNGFHKS